MDATEFRSRLTEAGQERWVSSVGIHLIGNAYDVVLNKI